MEIQTVDNQITQAVGKKIPTVEVKPIRPNCLTCSHVRTCEIYRGISRALKSMEQLDQEAKLLEPSDLAVICLAFNGDMGFKPSD